MTLVDPGELGFVALLAFVCSTIGGISGFGAGLMMTPFLVPVVGVKGVVPVIAVAMVLGNLAQVWVNRAAIEWRFLLRLLLATLPGVVIGTLIYDALPMRALAVVIGCFMIGSIALRRALKRHALQASPKGALAVGFGFGLLSGSSPGAGILMISILLGFGPTGGALISTDAVIGLGVNAVKSVMFGGLDLLELDTVVRGLVMGLGTVPGAYAARWLTEQMGARLHVAFIEAVVIVGGLYFLYKAAVP